MGERSRSGSRARARIRAGLVAAAASAAATGVALVVHPDRAFGAVPLYLLSVVVAAAIGGAGSGLATSVLSFLSLNYFFTQPRHTLRVTHAEDVVALVVFLVVAVIVGSLLSRALAERARAVRSERDARLLGFFATKVMSGVALDAVLDDLAGALRGFAPAGELPDPGPSRRPRVRDRPHPRRSRCRNVHDGVDPHRRRGRGDACRYVGSRSGSRIRRRPAPAGGGRAPGRRRDRARHARRADRERSDGGRDQPGARRTVLLGDARPADAARVHQGGASRACSKRT